MTIKLEEHRNWSCAIFIANVFVYIPVIPPDFLANQQHAYRSTEMGVDYRNQKAQLSNRGLPELA